MVSMIKKIDIIVFNHFAPKKCTNHQRRKAYSLCLHEDCWSSESDEAFFCGDCNINHTKKHGNSLRFDVLFTDEIFDEFDDYMENQKTNNKLKERIKKFHLKINELHMELVKWTICQFAELKKFFENHLIESDYFESLANLKEILSDARIDLNLNNEFKEKVKIYCTQIQNIKNNINDIMNGQVINDEEKNDEEWNLKLQEMVY